MPGVGIEVAGTAVSGFSFLALAAEVEGAGVPAVDDGVGGFSTFSLGFSFSLAFSGSRSLRGSARGPSVAREFDVGAVVVVEWATEVLA